MLVLEDGAFAEALQGDHTAVARLVTLWPGLSVREAYESRSGILTAASTTFDRTRAARRTGQFTAANPRGGHSPKNPGDEFYTGSLFRIEVGAVINGLPAYLTLATLVVTGYGASMRGVLSVSGEDPSSLLAQPFGDVVSVSDGTPAEDALVALWEPVLGPLVGDADSWSLDGNNRTTPNRAWAEEDDRLTAGLSLMADLGLEAFLDRRGVPVLRPVPDPTKATPVRSFVVEAGRATMTDLSRTGDRRLYNRVVVIGDNPNANPVRGQADVTDRSSPLHADTIGLQVAPYYHSAQIPDEGAAYAVAAARLVDLALVQDAVGGASFPDFTLDEQDVVAFDEPVSATRANYRFDQVTHNALAGGMSFSGSRVVPLFAE